MTGPFLDKKLYQFFDKFTFATYQGKLDVVKHISWWEFVTPKMFFIELIVKKKLYGLPNCIELYQFKYRYNFAIYIGNLDVVKYIAQFGGNEISCSQNVFLKNWLS